MNRRGFLAAMLASGAAPAIVRASSLMPIWVPRESGLLVTRAMDGRIIRFEEITREALRLLYANRTFVGYVNREYSAAFKEGDVLSIRIPQPYRVRP